MDLNRTRVKASEEGAILGSADVAEEVLVNGKAAVTFPEMTLGSTTLAVMVLVVNEGAIPALAKWAESLLCWYELVQLL
ncbi:hypothetical protein NDU88_002157 [Pleurodeles waltl]|uniref:Uncharacterized protein n=1 Tax=Pleurodeles waltl TaxID=8319 RepID=A0AAV7T1H5_PLEWA|nr:hypothetical protein NDU88_002157 [Pleurodeles waltl]